MEANSRNRNRNPRFHLQGPLLRLHLMPPPSSSLRRRPSLEPPPLLRLFPHQHSLFISLSHFFFRQIPLQIQDKERRIAAHRRAVLRKKSEIAERSRKLTVIESQMGQETTKMKESTAELSNLRRVRQASVALNVWQPEVVRGRQKQMVEQCVVPAESRIRALEMELRLCKQQIMGLEKSYKDENRRLDTAKEELLSMTYHPITEHKPMNKGETEHTVKRKKLKR